MEYFKKREKVIMTNVQKFIKKYNSLVDIIGAEKSNFYDWKIKTRLGVFWFSIHHKPDEKRVKLYSIYGCFSKPGIAWTEFNCNPHSGKHNFHYTNFENCIDNFKWFLEKLLDKEIN